MEALPRLLRAALCYSTFLKREKLSKFCEEQHLYPGFSQALIFWFFCIKAKEH